MPQNTTRLTLQEPLGIDAPSELRLAITNHATTLDNAAIFLSGTFVSRPVAGTAGRYYLATDVHDGGPQGTLYQDNGATWVYPNQMAYAQGTAGSRPSAGTQGRVYQTTDTGQFAVDNGTVWIPQGLSRRAASGNLTANPGVWIDAQAGVTITLPAGYVGAMIAITTFSNVTGSSPVTVTGTNIYGMGLAGVPSFPLGIGVAPVILAGGGGGTWNMIAGQQDTGWVRGTNGTNISGTFYSRLVGDTVRLSGSVQNLTGGFISVGYTWGTVPSTARPISTKYGVVSDLGANAPSSFQMRTDGTFGAGNNINNGASVVLDGITYPVNF